MSEIAERLTNGCQGGRHPLRGRSTIKSDHADIIRNAPPLLVDSPIDADGLRIARGDEGAGWIGEIEESLGLQIAALHAKIALSHILGIKGKTGALQGRAISRQPPSADQMGEWPRDHRDPAVPKREQILCSG